MSPYSDDNAKAGCGCIALGIIALIVIVILRTYILTPTGWEF